MKTYVFPVELEPDEEGWRAFYPPLEKIGASTWGATHEEALRNIQEVLMMILEEKAETADSMLSVPGVTVSEGASVSVTL